MAPQVFNRIVSYEFFVGKFINPIVSAVEQGFVSSKNLNAKKLYLAINPDKLKKVHESFNEIPRPWQSAYLSNENFKNVPVEIKLRGENAWHWSGKKKSLWIKTRGTYLFEDWKRMSLQNMKYELYFVDLLFYKLTREFGGLAPDDVFTHLYINRKHNGLYHELIDFDDHFLRKSNFGSGSIYFYDNLDSKPNDFFNDVLWKKRSSSPNEKIEDKSKLRKLLSITKNDCSKLDSIVDIEKYAVTYSLLDFFGSHHLDYTHNHRLVYSDASQKFSPISWDLFHYDMKKSFDISYNALSKCLLEYPRFRETRYRIFNKIVQKLQTDFAKQYHEKFYAKYKSDFIFDRNRGSHYNYSYFSSKIREKQFLKDVKTRTRQASLYLKSNPKIKCSFQNNKFTIINDDYRIFEIGQKGSKVQYTIGSKWEEIGDAKVSISKKSSYFQFEADHKLEQQTIVANLEYGDSFELKCENIPTPDISKYKESIILRSK